MYLAIFHEFCNPKIIEIVRTKLPNLEIRISTPIESSSTTCDTILRTNVKLFYDKDNVDKVDDVLEILKRIGFKVIDRNPFIMQKKKDYVLMPSDEFNDGVCCECGNIKRTPINPIKKVMVIDVTHFYDDRVILELEDYALL